MKDERNSWENLKNSDGRLFVYADRLVFSTHTVGEKIEFTIPRSNIVKLDFPNWTLHYFRRLKISYKDEQGQIQIATVFPHEGPVLFRILGDAGELYDLLKN